MSESWAKLDRRSLGDSSAVIQRSAISLHEDFRTAFLVLLCVQQPVKVVTLEMRRIFAVHEMRASHDAWSEEPDFVWELFPLRHLKANEIAVAPDEDLWILPRTFFRGRCLCARGAALGFDEFGRGLARPARRSSRPPDARERRPRAAEGFLERIQGDMPWLSQSDLNMALGRGTPGESRRERARGSRDGDAFGLTSSSASASDASGDEVAEPALPMFDADELVAMREAAFVAEHRAMDFYVRILGGRWTYEHTGEVADACSYFARAGQAQTWCRLYQFPRQRGFNYRKHGGRDGPHVLSNEIARRAQHFYDLWMASVGQSFRYSAADLAAYEASGEFRDLLAGVEAGSPLHRAALQVQDLYPKNPE